MKHNKLISNLLINEIYHEKGKTDWIAYLGLIIFLGIILLSAWTW